MNEWDEAARKAANAIFNSEKLEVLPSLNTNASPRGVKDEMTELIAKHFAELKATHEKLVELAAWCEREVDYADPSTDYESFKKIIDDPLVVAAIERSKGNG